MSNSLQASYLDLSAFSKNWGWFCLWGLVLIALGIAAISAVTLTTVISVVFLGILLLVGGLVVLLDTFTFWWRRWEGFFLHLIFGILYLALGLSFIKNPIEGSISLTLLLGILFIMLGGFRMIYSLILRTPKWGWNLFNGIISLLLGIIIMTNWPVSGLYIIGLFVGIDLIFCGWSYLIAALSARTLIK